MIVHKEAYDFAKAASFMVHYPRVVVEFGSRNVNGTTRDLFKCERYYGIDLNKDWEGVDEEANAAFWKPPAAIAGMIDVVVCCECLEHAAEAPLICRNAQRVLSPGGIFVVTAANEKRQPHTTTGLPNPQEHSEYYCPVFARALQCWLHCFAFSSVMERNDDVYALAWVSHEKRLAS